MHIDLKFRAENETIYIESAKAGFNEQIVNTILIDTERNKLCAIGRTAEVIAAESPDVWAGRSPAMTFFPVYSSDKFDSLHTFVVVKFYSFAIHSAIKSAWIGFPFGRFDRFNLDLQLENYEQLPKTERDRFEYEILSARMGYGSKVARLKINQQEVTQRDPTLVRQTRNKNVANRLANIFVTTLNILGMLAVAALAGLILFWPPIFNLVTEYSVAMQNMVDNSHVGIQIGLFIIILVIAGIPLAIVLTIGELIGSVSGIGILNPFLSKAHVAMLINNREFLSKRVKRLIERLYLP